MNKEETTEVVPVTIEELMDNLNAEEDEQPLIENVILPQAQAYVDNYLNVNDKYLSHDELVTKKRVVLMMATDWYFNRQGEGNTNKRSYSGMNAVLDSIRNQGIGTEDYDDYNTHR